MRILVPVDGSAHSDAALDFVASRSSLRGQDPAIALINVQPALSPRVTRAVGREEARAFQRAQADDVLRPAMQRLAQAGVTARASYALGGRADAIAVAAARRRTDLIVMGSRGHSSLKGLVFGSMTSAVLATCNTPLLVLRSGQVPQRDSLAVGIAVDGSRFGQAAVRWALTHRVLFGAEPQVHLLHVQEAPSVRGRAYAELAPDDPAAPAFDAVLAGPLKRLQKAGLAARPVRLQAPSAGDALAAYARQRRLDLLVLGSHGRGALQSLVLGSVAMRVAARCETPLLLIRAPERPGD